MAVYDRNFGIYQGVRTPTWSRFLILPRYAYQEVFQSRLFVAFLGFCCLMPFAGLLIIYLHHNLAALSFINLPLDRLQEVLPINAAFFRRGLGFQGFLCFVLALIVGPALISPDLRNNGLPLYLSRPFSRTEYVLGKLAVLALLMSAITWVPRVGVGEVEAGGAHLAPHPLLRSLGLRRGPEQDPGFVVGIPGGSVAHHDDGVDAPLRDSFGGGRIQRQSDAPRSGLVRPDRLLPDLPRASRQADPGL